MDEFHEMVSKVLHPVENGNLQPVKSNSAALLEKATAWRSSTVPPAYQYPQLAADLDKLVADCNNLDVAVKAKKGNKELKQLAMLTHNQFHAIVTALKNRKVLSGSFTHRTLRGSEAQLICSVQ